MTTASNVFALAMLIGISGISGIVHAGQQCSTQDKISLAKSGYAKQDIEELCAQSGTATRDNPSNAAAMGASEANTAPVSIDGKTGMDTHGAYQRNDFATARKLAEPLAQAGDPIAMRTLGRMRDFGKGLRKDKQEAVSWYRKAADKGDGWAMYNLAGSTSIGEGGLRKDPVAAEAIANKAIAAGFANGYRMLAGIRLESGNQAGYTEALSRGVEAGAIWAIEQRGYDLIYGSNGASKDVTAGTALLERSALAGERSAAMFLGLQYHHGHNGFPKDRNRSFKWFTKAAELHHPEAMLQLSAMLESGEDMPKNQSEADIWQRKAAEAGDPRSAWFEAEALRNKGQDEEAAKFYLISALGGNEDATYQLGYLYGTSDKIGHHFKSAYWYLISEEIEPEPKDGSAVKRSNTLTLYSGFESKRIPESANSEIENIYSQLEVAKTNPWEESSQMAASNAAERIVGLLLEVETPINALILAKSLTGQPSNQQAYKNGYLQVSRILKFMHEKTGDKSYLPQAISALMVANLSTTPTPDITALARDYGDAEEALRIAAAASEKRIHNATFEIVGRSFSIYSEGNGVWEKSKALMDKYSLTVESMASYNNATPLHMAARYDNAEAIEKLLAMGADINAKNSKGVTPLHIAVWHAKYGAIGKLLEKGADINAKDNDGDTPLDYANHKDLWHIIYDLEAKGAKRGGLLM